MKRNEKYETPELEIVRFAANDVLTTSGGYNGVDLDDPDYLEGA